MLPALNKDGLIDVQEKDSNIQEASTLWKDCQKWTLFVQLHHQQPDGDPDGD